MSGRILVVDDEREMCEAIAAGLDPRGYDVRSETSAEAALATLEGAEVDVVLTDLNMRGMDGLALCERIVASRPDVPVVVITAFGSLETAIAAIRAGAYDFITKPVKMDALAVALSRAVQHRSLREEVKRLRHLVGEAERFDELVGDSGPMRRVRRLIERVVDSDASVLVTGESGTGKEVVARVLHRRGRRKNGPFVAINCAVRVGLMEPCRPPARPGATTGTSRRSSSRSRRRPYTGRHSTWSSSASRPPGMSC